MPLTTDDIAAIAKAVNEYNDGSSVLIKGQPYKANLFELAHGAHVATNDPAGGLEQTRGQVNRIFHDFPTLAEIEGAIAAHLGAGGAATPADIAAAVDALFAQKLAA